MEATIDRLNASFLELADSVIVSEAYKKDPGVLQKLIATTRQVVALAQVNNESESTAVSSILTDVVDAHTNTSRELESPDYTPALNQHNITVALRPQHKWLSISNDLQVQLPQTRADTPPKSRFTGLENPFGNGWVSKLPQVLEVVSKRSSVKVDQNSFGFRLLQFTLQNAYWALFNATNANPNISESMFRFARPFHSKEELLYNIRWFIGPGRSDSHILMDKSLHDLDALLKDDENILDPMINIVAIEEMKLKQVYSPSSKLGTFFSVKEIEDYLGAKDARYIDQNTLEISVISPNPILEILSPDVQSKVTINGNTGLGILNQSDETGEMQNLGLFSSPSDAATQFSYQYPISNAEMPLSSPNNYEQTPISSASSAQLLPCGKYIHRRIRVQVQTLLHSLTDISVCLVKGPGYEQSVLETAITSAVIPTPFFGINNQFSF